MSSQIHNAYYNNKPFNNYVDKYAKCNEITPEEALEHAVVQQVWRYYTEL